MDSRSDGHKAYDAYVKARGGFAINGDKLPPFGDQAFGIRSAWEAAAVAAVESRMEREVYERLEEER